jgi:DNA-binding response OmpR family regulator
MARVLLVSDDPAVIEQVKTALKADDHDVETISPSAELLTYLRSDPAGLAAVLIVDNQSVWGEMVASGIRSDPALMDLRVIVLRAGTGGEEMMSGTRGADMYLAKPFHPAELCKFVWRLVSTGESP